MKILIKSTSLHDSLLDKPSVFEVSDVIFGADYNESLVHQVITSYTSNARSGNRAQKDRSDVKHSTKKPWRQKGTGNARAGMRSSPLWRGGGKVFPSSPEENFSKKVNRKMYRSAMCSILSRLLREDRIEVVEDILIDSPRTKQFIKVISSFGVPLKQLTLIVVDSLDDNLYLASRNLPNIAVVEVKHLTPLALAHCKKLVITKKAVDALSARLILKSQCSSNLGS